MNSEPIHAYGCLTVTGLHCTCGAKADPVQPRTVEPRTTCPLCGAPAKAYTADEGTQSIAYDKAAAQALSERPDDGLARLDRAVRKYRAFMTGAALDLGHKGLKRAAWKEVCDVQDALATTESEKP
jgi:hypothetical protein